VLVEKRRHVGQRDVLVEERLADAAQQDEGQGARVHLLVVQHVRGERCRPSQARPRSRAISLGSPAARCGGDARGIIGAAQARRAE
jgi:hypothetical protein